jgi:hypothetical protein
MALGLGSLLVLFCIWAAYFLTNLEENQEIRACDYKYLSSSCQLESSYSQIIQPFMSDGKITNKEFNQIDNLREKQIIESSKKSLKETLK